MGYVTTTSLYFLCQFNKIGFKSQSKSHWYTLFTQKSLCIFLPLSTRTNSSLDTTNMSSMRGMFCPSALYSLFPFRFWFTVSNKCFPPVFLLSQFIPIFAFLQLIIPVCGTLHFIDCLLFIPDHFCNVK